MAVGTARVLSGFVDASRLPYKSKRYHLKVQKNVF